MPGLTAPSQPTVRPWLLASLLVAALAVGLGLFFGASTQDDAFISFRYADNLVKGHGLVFNPGERVEGYTNLLWTLILAGMMALGIEPVPGSTALGLLSLGAAVVLTGGLARRVLSAGTLIVGVAAALLALDPWTVLESVEGLETAFYMLLVTVATGLVIKESQEGASLVAHLPSSLVWCLAALTRPEAPLLAGLSHLGLLIAAPDRRLQLRRSLVAAVPLLVCLGGLTAWRLAWYGAPLPNTFYAKTGGLPLQRGLLYLLDHALKHPALWLLLVLRPLGGPLRRQEWPLLVTTLGTLAYVVLVGGDFKPTGRFVMPVLPLMAVLGAGTLAGRRIPVRIGAGVALLVLMVGAGLAMRGASSWAEIRHANMEARRTVGLFLARTLPPDTLIAIHSAGAIPYYAGLPTIDMWGLADAHIARSGNPAMGEGMAGHERTDPDYVFSRDPAIYLPEDRLFTLRPWPQPVEPGFPAVLAERYEPLSIPVEGRYLNVWVRKGLFEGRLRE